jgi:prevent-host-death family protein
MADQNGSMTRVSITKLKAELSRYLREARRGGEVQILDRGVPVARLTGLEPPGPQEEEERRRRLIDAGIIRPGSGGVAEVLGRPPAKLGTDLSGALDDERADRL